MSQNIKRVPKLRFPDFSGEWGAKPLGDIMNISSSKRVHAEDWSSEGVPFYRAREIVLLHKNLPITPLFIGNDLYVQCSNQSGEIKPGDLLVTGVGTIGVQYLVKDSDKFYFKDGNIIWFKNGNIINGKFLFYSFDTLFVKDQIRSMAGIGTVATYTIESAKLTEVYLPTKEEQSKIAEFFTLLDDEIQTQEQIIKTLEDLKKGYIQKIFSQQLRFKDENGEDFPEWEEVMIGDIATLKNGYSFKSDLYDENGTYNIITIGNVTGDKYINVEKSNKIIELPNSIQKHQILKQNDILVSLTGNVGRVSLNKGSNNLLNQRVGLIEVNGNISPIFIYYCLSLKEFEKSMNNSGNGLAQLNIGKSTIEEYTIFVPNLVEQEIIVSFLELLDEKIDTEKTKLINLQKLKLGYLQQMFI